VEFRVGVEHVLLTNNCRRDRVLKKKEKKYTTESGRDRNPNQFQNIFFDILLHFLSLVFRYVFYYGKWFISIFTAVFVLVGISLLWERAFSKITNKLYCKCNCFLKYIQNILVKIHLFPLPNKRISLNRSRMRDFGY